MISKKKFSFSLKECELHLDTVEKRVVLDGWSDSLRKERLDILTDIWKGTRKEEQMWRQKSRVRWLKESDKNTSLFHCMANNRRRCNYIGNIRIEGTRFSNPVTVKIGIRDHFQSQYKNVKWQRLTISGLDLKRLSDHESESLECSIMEEEVWIAVNCCDGNKAPGSDGLNLDFVKANWDLIKGDFMNFIRGIHNDGKIFKDINKTFIVLIPKNSAPKSLYDYRPISLVTSMYKILAKVLANRLKNVMDVIISECQTAFVKNSQILDNYVVAEEIIHEWKNNKEGILIINLDFEKAYDSVDHAFLDDMMRGMGFEEKWRQWIKNGISTPMMSVLVNGSSTSQFRVERGLRQGDPLSPFLFNIVTEGLSCLICKKAHFPITYLGLPLRARPSSKAFWGPVLKRMESRWLIGIGSFSTKAGVTSISADDTISKNVFKEIIVPDILAWIPKRDGIFSVASFRKCLEEDPMINVDDFKFLWQGVSPPKIEIFLWQLLKGRVMVRKVLQRFGLDSSLSIFCPLCDQDEESVDHISLHCRLSWKLWSQCMAWWDVESCANKAVTGYLYFSKGWQSSEDFNLELSFNKCSQIQRGWMISGNVGIIGVLRNNSGLILGLFLLFMGTRDSRLAEILAIHKAVTLCSQSVQLKDKTMDIVSDSSKIVSWVNSEGPGNLEFVDIIYETRQALSFLGNTRVIYNPRSSNTLVDSHAKNGSAARGDKIILEF
ncbi:hypothetical protein Ddye_005806 [Dipteronia dyeriana]|uniref:Reverse transcriptase domain-containing protein n=1 Tax=Dipteronia dyeriana TaxID=168575 RepID=A0AAD9XHU5_9ROSI|nr:hypothetical protein Ddye_005806 [Dipteronia dyeriana]